MNRKPEPEAPGMSAQPIKFERCPDCDRPLEPCGSCPQCGEYPDSPCHKAYLAWGGWESPSPMWDTFRSGWQAASAKPVKLVNGIRTCCLCKDVGETCGCECHAAARASVSPQCCKCGETKRRLKQHGKGLYCNTCWKKIEPAASVSPPQPTVEEMFADREDICPSCYNGISHCDCAEKFGEPARPSTSKESIPAEAGDGLSLPEQSRTREQILRDFQEPNLSPERCGELYRELHRAATVSLPQPATSALELLALMYDRWEDGELCYEDPEDFTGSLGHAINLTESEEDQILEALKGVPAAGVSLPVTKEKP